MPRESKRPERPVLFITGRAARARAMSFGFCVGLAAAPAAASRPRFARRPWRTPRLPRIRTCDSPAATKCHPNGPSDPLVEQPPSDSLARLRRQVMHSLPAVPANIRVYGRSHGHPVAVLQPRELPHGGQGRLGTCALVPPGAKGPEARHGRAFVVRGATGASRSSEALCSETGSAMTGRGSSLFHDLHGLPAVTRRRSAILCKPRIGATAYETSIVTKSPYLSSVPRFCAPAGRAFRPLATVMGGDGLDTRAALVRGPLGERGGLYRLRYSLEAGLQGKAHLGHSQFPLEAPSATPGWRLWSRTPVFEAADILPSDPVAPKQPNPHRG